MSARRPSPRFLLWALAIVLIDQATKLIVYRTMTLNGAPIPLLGELLRLTYIHNAGAAFGLFQGSRWFFVGVSFLAMLVLVTLALSDKYREERFMVAFGLIFGGALGNLIDRLWLGVVIDFIQMGVNGHYWPVYNVADIGVSVGVALLALSVVFDRSDLQTGSTSGAAEPPSAGIAAPAAGSDLESPGRSGPDGAS